MQVNNALQWLAIIVVAAHGLLDLRDIGRLTDDIRHLTHRVIMLEGMN